MSDSENQLISRGEIARLAGVRRPAVTNWERRHADFPRPSGRNGNGADLFDALEITTWLDGRAVPANARESREPAGTTYGARLRARRQGQNESDTSQTAANRTLSDVIRTLAQAGESISTALSLRTADYLSILLTMVHMQASSANRWRRLVAIAREPEARGLQERFVSELSDPGSARLISRWRGGDTQLAFLVLALNAPEGTSTREYITAFEEVLDVEYVSAVPPADAGELFTPRSVARTLAALLASQGPVAHVHDPFCRSGELLAAAVDAQSSRRGETTGISGATANEESLRLARQRVEVRGARADSLALGPAAPSLGATTPTTADVVVANPPFNVRTPRLDRRPAYWRYGEPPAYNANFDWLQYLAASVSESGRAGVVMPNNAAFSRRGGEHVIRAAMVEAGVVECVVQLPAGLFSATGVAVTLWILRAPTSGDSDVLFVDAERLGHPVNRTVRQLSDRDVTAIADAYHHWTRARDGGQPYQGVAGLSRAVPIEELRANDHALTPSLFVPAADQVAGDGEDLGSSLAMLSEKLSHLHRAASTLDDEVERLVRRYRK